MPTTSLRFAFSFGLTLAQARERYGKREKARYRKWAETVAFFATDCSFLDIANLVDRSVAQVVHEIHDTWYEDYMLGCIDYIASVAYHGGILLKPITTEKEITGHIGDTILSWCEKGQKDDGGNELKKTAHELAKQGTNLNQFMKFLNTYGIKVFDVGEAQRVLAREVETFMEVAEALAALRREADRNNIQIRIDDFDNPDAEQEG